MCEDYPSRDKPTMRLCLHVVPQHVGDIAVSWVLQVGNHSHPRLRSPLLDRIADVVESRRKCFESYYIYRRVGFFLLLCPFVALVRSPNVEVLTLLSSNFSKKKLGSRGYLGIVLTVL